MSRTRRFLRRVAYRSGGLGLMREKLRHALTVVMFHRVIDAADPDFADADPTDTVPARFFDELLDFFEDHYNLVGLADLMAAADGARPLPEHALLITFDDGWADNLRYAAPLLKSRGLPAAIFIAAEPVLSPADGWWQQQVFDAARRGTLASALSRARITGTVGTARGADQEALDLVCRLAGLPQSQREAILSLIPAPAPASRMMLARDDLATLAKFGFAVGIHGYSHLPLTAVRDLHSELLQARSVVASLSGDDASARALACPHGRYDRRVLSVSREAGIKLIFTSDPVLNPVEGGMIAGDRQLGRISMEAPHLADQLGRLDLSAAATWLWHRPIASGKAHGPTASGVDAD